MDDGRYANLAADYERLGTTRAVAAEYQVSMATIKHHARRLQVPLPPSTRYPGGRVRSRAVKTSICFSGPLAERREDVREYTGYTDPQVYELGLLPIEAELKAAWAQTDEYAITCAHERRYPNGYCQDCYARPSLAGRNQAPPAARSGDDDDEDDEQRVPPVVFRPAG